MKTIIKCTYVFLEFSLWETGKHPNFPWNASISIAYWYHTVPLHYAFPGPLAKISFYKDIQNASGAKSGLPGYFAMMMNSLVSARTEFKKHDTPARKITCQISGRCQITSGPISLDDPSPKYGPGTLPWMSANWTLAGQGREGNPDLFPYKSQPKSNLDYL